MHIIDIERSLPNGLHDAILKKYEIDYESSTATLYLDVWIGDLHSKSDEDREKYVSATLNLSGLRYWAIDPPSKDAKLKDGSYAFGSGDIDELRTHTAAELPAQDSNTFTGYLFLYLLETFAYYCAEDATIQLTSEPFTHL